MPSRRTATGRTWVRPVAVRGRLLADGVAAGALEALHAARRSVPGDVALVGFDDSAWARRCRPTLTTVRQPAGLLGEAAAGLVLRQLQGEDVGTDGQLLPTEVVVRGSG